MSKQVLIIEDSKHHQAAALAQLPDAVVVNYNEAFDVLCDVTALEKYSAMLTDLFFLVDESKRINPAPFNYPKNRAMVGTEQPFGVFFAMKGVELGLPTAVVTDGDHHSNLFIGLLDMFGRIQRKGYVLAAFTDNQVSIPDPGFSILHEIEYPTAKDMYWDESGSGELITRPVSQIKEEQKRAYDSLPREERARAPLYSGWKYVKDWRRALAVALREHKE